MSTKPQLITNSLCLNIMILHLSEGQLINQQVIVGIKSISATSIYWVANPRDVVIDD